MFSKTLVILTKGAFMTVQDFKPSASVKAAVVAVEILFWLGMLTVVLSVALVITVNITSFSVKYIRAPLSVCYAEGGGVSLPGQEVAKGGPLVTGFSGITLKNGGHGRQKIFVIMPLLLSMLFMGIVMILRKIIRSIRGGTPFTRGNAARIRAMGWLVMISGPFWGILEYIYGRMLLPTVSIEGAAVEVDPDMRIFYVFVGLLIVAIGHVFQYGVGLKEDSELTV